MISITRLFRLGIRVAAWATPRVQQWNRERNLNRSEGQRHLEARNFAEAERYLNLALEERRHPDTRRLELLLDIAQAQRGQKKLPQAEETACHAIELAVRSRDAAMHSLALEALLDAQFEQGRHVEAEKTGREIERLEEAQPKPSSARLAICSHKRATALTRIGLNHEAAQALQQGVKHAEQAFGPNHAQVGDILSQLGALQRHAGDHTEAQRSLRRALQIHGETAGHASHEATQDLHHLAVSLEESGDLDSAAREYERMLTLRERQLGGNKEDVADVQVRLAALYLRAGRSAAANELLTQAIATLERKGGSRYRAALELMVSAEESAGRFENAKRWRERAGLTPAANSN